VSRQLLANRNFALLWIGDVLSEFGSQATAVAMPLLVLSLTGSPAKAGIVAFARSVAYPLSPLPAGVLADRFDRRQLMILCAAGRAVAMGSVALVLAVGRPPLLQLVAVAFLNALGWTVSTIAERGLLTAVVPGSALADAVALNEARESVALIGGPPLGGALFGIARGLPFIADTASFVAAGLAALGVRVQPDTESPVSQGRPGPAIREGMSWLWRAPFLRDGSLLYAAANVTIGAVELLAVLIARHHGASSAAIGVAFAIVGAGGVAGAALARPLRGRLTPRWSVLCEPWFSVALAPMLLFCRSALAVGLVVAFMFLPLALSSSVVIGHRLALAPDHLRGRVQASAAFIAGSIAWIGPLAAGVLFQAAGETTAVVALAGWTFAVAITATLSRGLRQVPSGPPPAIVPDHA
jgi:predicted MFS family arabinose efflux permease